MIDKDYTKDVRGKLAGGDTVVYTAYTEEEFDWLWDHGGEEYHDASEIIALTEEQIERTTGLKVDLRPEGPAHTVISMSGKSERQEHNTFRVQETEAMARAFLAEDRDQNTIPKVTPEDANWAAKSLDFPASRPTGTALDGMRIDDKENPIEMALISQLTVCQILSHWDIDVTELAAAIDIEWGIDYSLEIVKSVALAKVEDLDEFIASGGRPAPSVNLSPNILSRYKVLQGPTVRPDTVGYHGSFIGRCKAMCKMTMCTVNVARGPGSVATMEFHMNPAYFTDFHPSKLEGWEVTGTSKQLASHYRTSIPGLSTYDAFIGVRQASAIAARNERIEIGKAVFEAMSGARACPRTAKDLEGWRLYEPELPSKQLIAIYTPTGVRVERRPMVNDPRKVTAVAFDIFSELAGGHGYLNLLTCCGEVAALCSVDRVDLELGKLWPNLVSQKGIGAMYKDANLYNLEKIPGMIAAGFQYSGSNIKLFYFISLLIRQLDHMRPKMKSVLSAVAEHIAMGTKIAGTGPMQSVTVAGMTRIWKVLQDVTSKSPRPFSRMRAMKANATSSLAGSSMLSIDPLILSEYSAGRHLLTPKAFGGTIRSEWVSFYNSQLRSWEHVAYLSVKMKDRRVYPWKMSRKSFSDGGKHALVNMITTMAYQEMLVSAALKLAYKWCTVDVTPKSGHSGLGDGKVESTAREMVGYIEVLRDYAFERIEVVVLGNEDKIGERNQMTQDFHGAVTFILSAFYGNMASKVKVRWPVFKQLKEVYCKTWKSVKATISECVMNDQAYVRSFYSTPIRFAAIADPASESHSALAPEASEIEEPPDKDAGIASDDIEDQINAMLAAGKLGLCKTNNAESSDKEYETALDMLYAGQSDLLGADSDLDIMYDDFLESLTSDNWKRHKPLIMEIADYTKAIIGMDAEVVEIAVADHIKPLVIDYMLKIGISAKKRDIMS